MTFAYRLLLASFLLLIFVSIAYSQDRAVDRVHQKVFQKIDRAYQQGKIDLDKKILFKLYAGKMPAKLPSDFRPTEDGILKCGTPAISDFQNKRSQLSQSSISEVESMMKNPTTQASETYESPSGKFMIHYETTGPDAVPGADSDNDGVPDYVEWTAEAADSSWSHEVSNLGYSDPIVGSSDPYKIYIEIPFFGSGTYGETHLGSYKNVNDQTVIVINNELDEPRFHVNTDENPTHGAIKVTVAHEFKHAVQYTANQWNGETFNWLEMDATLMEEVVYDDVNDYYNYIRSSESIFINPQNSFYPFNGASYYIVTWALFFEEKFGSQFWVDIWETISANPNIAMIDAITQQLGGTQAYNRNYIESQLWHFASGPNSSSAYGFEESANYPAPKIEYSFVGDDSLSAPDTLNNLSAKYFDIQPSPFPGSVAFNFSDLITPKAGFGIIAYFNDGSVEPLILFNEQQETISYETDWQWDEIQRLGIVAANGSPQQQTEYGATIRSIDPSVVRVQQNYPNPFSEQTTIRYSIPEQKHVRLEVFDVLGRKVATLVNESQPQGIYPTLFTADGLASGIYFYRIIIDGEVTTKKMTLIK